MPFASVRDIEIYYERRGEGPPLLILSGTNADLRRKPTLMESILPRHFDVVAFDQRGLGQSGKPEQPYTMADYADDAAALMDVLGWANAMMLGISFGGSVAQALALRHPARVTRLALACANPGGSYGYDLLTLEDVTPDARAEVILRLDTRRTPDWIAANPEKAEALRRQIIARGLPFDPTDPQGRAGLRRQLEARADHDALDRLHEVRVPVGLFGGRYDGLGTVAGQEAMRAAFPDATLQLFEGGHAFLNEDPAALPAIVDFFLS